MLGLLQQKWSCLSDCLRNGWLAVDQRGVLKVSVLVLLCPERMNVCALLWLPENVRPVQPRLEPHEELVRETLSVPVVVENDWDSFVKVKILDLG